MRVLLLGCGFHGRGIAYHLAKSGRIDELMVADKDPRLAARVADKTGADWLELDVNDSQKLRSTLQGTDVVFNAVGPYHLLGLKVIEAALDTGTQYVDMNDDHEVTEAIFLDPTWDKRAREAGIAVLSGCGIMPGLSGIMARYGYDQIEKPERVNIWFSWNYSLHYPAAIHHFLRINSGLGPQFLNGGYLKPGPFARREDIEFLPPVGTKSVYYTGVPDPVSISQSLPGLMEVTASGGLHQKQADKLIEDMVTWGFTSYDEVPRTGLSPMEFLMTYLTSPHGENYFHVDPVDAPMSVRVRVEGQDDGKLRSFTYEAHDYSRRGTTAVAALATLMIVSGELENRGVGSPESWIAPRPFLQQLLQEPDIKIFELQGGKGPETLQL